MKLFLSSQAISESQAPAFIELTGKQSAHDIKIALIENAAFGEPGEKPWLQENRAAIQNRGFDVEIIDLEDYRTRLGDLQTKLEGKDVVWFGGGNTYYLRWLLKDMQVDKLVKELVSQEKIIYGGGSAGAVVAGPTTEFFDTADDPNAAPEVILSGLSLTDTVIVPHWGDERYGSILHDINAKLKAAGYKTATINDDQALVIDGSTQVVIP